MGAVFARRRSIFTPGRELRGRAKRPEAFAKANRAFRIISFVFLLRFLSTQFTKSISKGAKHDEGRAGMSGLEVSMAHLFASRCVFCITCSGATGPEATRNRQTLIMLIAPHKVKKAVTRAYFTFTNRL